MQVVKGIYDDKDQLLIVSTLVASNPKMGVLFYVGVVSGLRIGDLLGLKVQDMSYGSFKVEESKTGKEKWVTLPDDGWELVKAYIEAHNLKPEDRLFKTTRQTAHKYFKNAALSLGLTNIGTHSMRKTYA
jgi:integrase